MPKPIQHVKFSKDAPKFEDRSPEETEWQEQGAREAAWKVAKRVLKLKEHERATFFSPSGALEHSQQSFLKMFGLARFVP